MRRRPAPGPAVTLAAIAIGGSLLLTGAGVGEHGAAHAGEHKAEHTAESDAHALSPAARAGKIAFDAKCAACHGANAAGTDKGPPLVHRIYEPGHHGDRAFWLAARNGARSHHWRFGDMPPVEGVTDEQLRGIVAYVREIQRANGIF